MININCYYVYRGDIMLELVLKQTKNMNKKKLSIIALCSLSFLGLVLAYLELSDKTHLFIHNEKKETVQEANARVSEKQALASSGKTSIPTPPSGNTEKPASPATNNVDTKSYNAPTSDKGIAIIATQANSSEEIITTKLTGYSDGTCSLTVSSNGKTTNQSAPVMFEKEFSTCAGFTVPISALGPGSWNIKLDVLSGRNTTSKTITSEVK